MLYSEYKLILKNHSKYLIGESGGVKADLSWAYLNEANLSGANLSRADLSGANLSGANLSGADLGDADLSRANLSRANLIGADLSGANLSWADLGEADLSWANLSGANFIGADLSWANLIGANFIGANLSWAIFNWANLSGALGVIVFIFDPRKKGYILVAWTLKNELWFNSGCRSLAKKAALDHWGPGYKNPELGRQYVSRILMVSEESAQSLDIESDASMVLPGRRGLEIK